MTASAAESNGGLEPQFLQRYSFAFDGFQLEAMDQIRAGMSVMVAAPTSAGKTVIAEYALWRTLVRGERAAYTAPVKALSNQKRRDLDRLFPGKVGILTGDRSENRGAPILVMTTEVLRNMLLEDPASLEGVSSVVFDEVHYIADRERGTIWEEAIITALPSMRLVCLSATIRNAEEIADWITQTHGATALIRHDERPVPLEHFSFTNGTLRLIRDVNGRRVAGVPDSPRRHGRRPAVTDPVEVITALSRADLLPAIWFAFTRHGVEADARRCAEGRPEVSGVAREQIESAIGWTLAAMPPDDRTLPQISTLAQLLRRGVGFHHAGLLPPCKELVEDLFVRGFLSVVTATDTLSVGINMPARTVIISSVSRPVGGLLTPNDFSQLTGRAGRRGIDERGAVVILPSPYYSFERAYSVLTGPLEPVLSSFVLRYSTMLSMFDRDKSEQRLAALVRSSLRQFQLYQGAREAEGELRAVERTLAEMPPSPILQDRERELEEYLELQRLLTAAERPSSRSSRHGRRTRPSARRRSRDQEEIETLRGLLRRHPMHKLAATPAFQTAVAERMDLLRARNRLQRVVDDARRERDRDADRTAHAVAAVLRRLGYVGPSGLRHKAKGLRQMVASSGIVLSEMYHEGLLSGLASEELAELLSWFACDVDRRRWNTFHLPSELNHVRNLAELIFSRVSALEDQQHIRLAQGPSNWFWGVALAWCRGRPISDIVTRIEIGEGDIVSILNKTIDLVDQFSGLLSGYRDETGLATAAEARRLLCRGIVAMIRVDSTADLEDELVTA